MDFILLFIGTIALLRSRTHTVITIITVLCSRYLQLPITSPFAINFLFPHNVEDLGLLLYILWFMTFLVNRRLSLNHPLSRCVVIFFTFLIISGVYDIFIGTSMVDIIKYMRQWLLLTAVFIAPYISTHTIKRSLKQVTVITIFICLFLLVVRVANIEILGLKSLEGRGIKPPSYSIVCALLLFANIWKYKAITKYTYIAILILPSLLSLKVTYVVTVTIMLVLYTIMNTSSTTAKKILMFLTTIMVSFFILSSSDDLIGRMGEMKTNFSSQSLGNIESEDNFTYRLAHATERLVYILESSDKTMRGLGYISEENYKEDAFYIGLWNEKSHSVVQLDTGDIAWSILFLRLGLLGLIIYLIFYLKLIATLRKTNSGDPLHTAYAIILIVFLVFTSLGNTIITTGEFFFIPLLISSYSKIKHENNSSNLVL